MCNARLVPDEAGRANPAALPKAPGYNLQSEAHPRQMGSYSVVRPQRPAVQRGLFSAQVAA